jgi:hypothetical protein
MKSYPFAYVGAGHAREQKGTGIGSFLVPEHKKVARMAASYNTLVGADRARDWPVARMAASYNTLIGADRARDWPVARMAALCPRVLLQKRGYCAGTCSNSPQSVRCSISSTRSELM